MTGSPAFDELTGSEVAIIGMSGRFPGARDLDQFWGNLARGVESIAFFDDDQIDPAAADQRLLNHPNYVKARGVLDDIELFDATFFGFSPREAQIRDPQHRIFLECAWEALEDAGYSSDTYRGAIGVYAGAGPNTYLLNNLLPNPQLVELVGPLQLDISSDKDFLPTLVSYKLNLKGPSFAVQTACSTSLVAVCVALQGLLTYQCDMALAGGVSIKVPHRSGYVYQEGGVLSPDGHCRAFDADAQGSIDGNGVGVVLLKRLADALQDGDHIYALIKGSAINNDGGMKVNYTAPSVDGQAEVIAMAQAFAGVAAETISYVETHGAGTVLGDPIEISALIQAFRGYTEAKGFCAIGSVKTNIGHLDAAAGIAGLIKTVLALKHRQIPPSLHFKRPNPRIDFANTPFYVNARLADWKTDRLPRRAGVSSFGVGGTNAHVVLEEAAPAPSPGPSRPWHLLLLSAGTPSALEQINARLADELARDPNRSLADVAYTLQVGRKALKHRRMLVCRDIQDAIATLQSQEPARVLSSVEETRERPIAFMFPGLGDHYVGMAAGLYQSEPVFREQFDTCAELLRAHLDIDIRAIVYPEGAREEPAPTNGQPRGIDLGRMFALAGGQTDPAGERLNQTIVAQPAVFAIEYALAQLWMAWGIRPQAVIGHSLGEYVAACVAGVLSLEDALLLVARRARMIQALPTGGMLSVLLPEEELLPLLGPRLSLAAVNEPAACGVAGPNEALEQLAQELAGRGITHRRLAATHAFHSSMMHPIMEPLTRLVRSIALNPPKIPYISNVTGTWITTAQATDPGYWARHLSRPVRFAAGVRELWKEPGRILLEVGPGMSLTSLALRQQLDQQQLALPSLRPAYDRQPDLAFMLGALGKLWLAGVQVDWAALHGQERRRRIPLPTYPFERKRYWIDPPVRKGLEAQGATMAAPPAPAELLDAPLEPIADGEPALRGAVRTPYVAPRDQLERQIASLWERLLGIPQAGVNDNFFELGGHSLLLPQLLAQLRDHCQVDLRLSSLFEAPTVAGLAELVGRIRRAGPDAARGGAAGLDLQAEVMLDPAIEAHGLPAEPVGEPAAILLTGASGFLGAFLLDELLRRTRADIYCLVRAPTVEDGRRRLLRNLATYQLQDERLAARIIAVPGDLAQPRWGLSEHQFTSLAGTIDLIYHCGAWVNFTYPYTALKAANVLGLQEALRLAGRIKLKPLHFVSSVAVFSAPAYAEAGVVREDTPLEHAAGLFSGYAETKWVAEHMLGIAGQRGIPVAIYRPGVIGGHSETGIGNPKDLIWNLIKGGIQLGVVPDLEGVPDIDTIVNITPVDYVSRAIVYLSRQPESVGKAFHFSNPQPMHWSEVVDVIRECGYPLRQVPGDEWPAILTTRVANAPENALFPFLPLFDAAGQQAGDSGAVPQHAKNLQFDSSNTLRGLAGSGIACPPLNARLLKTYLARFIESGFLETPDCGFGKKGEFEGAAPLSSKKE